MNEIPWFFRSPSVFSIAFWIVLAIWGAKQLLKRNSYRRLKYVNAFTDALFILGIVVLSTDLTWVLMSGLRFGWFYPDSVLQLLFCAGRDLAGLAFCYLLVGDYFRQKKVSCNGYTLLAFFLNVYFFAVWFLASPNPSLTDWTYALRYDYPLKRVLAAFLASHVFGRSLVVAIYYTIWRKP